MILMEAAGNFNAYIKDSLGIVYSSFKHPTMPILSTLAETEEDSEEEVAEAERRAPFRKSTFPINRPRSRWGMTEETILKREDLVRLPAFMARGKSSFARLETFYLLLEEEQSRKDLLRDTAEIFEYLRCDPRPPSKESMKDKALHTLHRKKALARRRRSGG